MIVRINVGKVIRWSLALGAVALLAKGCYQLEFSPEARARNAAERQQEADQKHQDSLPRKIREADGCEVWAFKPGPRWLYSMRCESKTSTRNEWETCRSVTQGKTTRQECTQHAMDVEVLPKP